VIEENALGAYPAPDSAPWARRLAETVTVETALWALVLVLAAVLRLAALGGLPLDAPEAQRALAAFQWARGDGAAVGPDMVPHLLAAGTFVLFGAGDTTARLLTALLGVATVAAVWLLRDLLGRPAALIGAALIALSPSFVFSARLLAPDGPAALLALLFAWNAFAYLRAGQPWRLYLAALLAAGLLQCGAGGLVDLLVLAGYVAVSAASGNLFAGLRERLRGRALQVEGALAVFIVLTLVLSSGFLTDLGRAPVPGGLSALVNLFDARGAGAPPLLVLLLFEPLALVFGLFGAWIALREDGPALLADPELPSPAASRGFLRLLVVWTAVAGAVLLAAGRGGEGALTVVLPLTLLAAVALGELTTRLTLGDLGRAFQYGGAAIPVLIFAAIMLGQASAPGNGASGAFATGLILPVVFALLAGAALLVVVSVIDGGRYALGVQVILVLFLGAFAIHSLWDLAYVRAPGDLYRPTWTAPSLPETARRIAGLAMAPGNETGPRVQVDPDARYPLAWYLRDVPDVTFASLGDRPTAPVLVALQTENAAGPEGYRAEEHALRSRNVRPSIEAAPLWRWYIARTSDRPPHFRD
jgi:hypothetical protein